MRTVAVVAGSGDAPLAAHQSGLLEQFGGLVAEDLLHGGEVHGARDDISLDGRF
ncbi:hypothetical protein ACQPZZ_15875 [Microbispora sp. CA-135349]|uniref:hypothetical protein n=1 Tax=Microbispora sp. CA-135349 TaxID=3239953 RepID=UPI003D946A93